MANRRKHQLDQEEILDARLRHECQSQCPDVLHNYFFNMRQLNRLIFMKLYDAPFYSYPSVTAKQIKVMDNIQISLFNSITETSAETHLSLCDALRKSNQHIQEEINKFLE